MTFASISSKGQITLPAVVREALSVTAGDRVEFVQVAQGRYELVASIRRVTALKGMFGNQHKSVSIEEMNATIAKMAAEMGAKDK